MNLPFSHQTRVHIVREKFCTLFSHRSGVRLVETKLKHEQPISLSRQNALKVVKFCLPLSAPQTDNIFFWIGATNRDESV